MAETSYSEELERVLVEILAALLRVDEQVTTIGRALEAHLLAHADGGGSGG